MRDLDKNKAYDLRGLSDEQLRELVGKVEINLHDLRIAKCIIYNGWWKYSHDIEKATAKAIDLFEPTNLEDLGFKPIGDGFYSIHLGKVVISVRKNVYVEDCDGIVELFEYDFEKVKKLVELWK